MRAARIVFSHWLLALCMLALASLAPLAGSESALASSMHHGHVAAPGSVADSRTALVQEAAGPRLAIFEAVVAHSGKMQCAGQESGKDCSGSSTCCGSMCSAAAVVWVAEFLVALDVRTVTHWLFIQQFIFSAADFGLDRPPDYLS